MVKHVIEGHNPSLKKNVKSFWNTTPCGTFMAKAKEGTKAYYEEIDDLRYNQYPYAYGYLKKVAPFAKVKGKKVLEIGCGVGTDLAQFAKHGAIVTGVDLTEAAIALAKKRFKVTGLKGSFQTADAENLPFRDETFDVVYSFGVIHHTPNTQRAVDEIRRVLKPGGRAFIMLYHTRSFEYFTLVARKAINPERWAWSLQDAINYETEMNRKKGGPSNPLTKTYTAGQAKKMFSKFAKVKTAVHWIRIPFVGGWIPEALTYPFSRILGWHLIIEAEK